MKILQVIRPLGNENINPLTVAIFQTNAATGTFAQFVERVNNNLVDAAAFADAVGQYAEVDFGSYYHIKQYRQYGQTGHAGTGISKLQYHTSSGWHDWITGIPSLTTLAWSEWIEGDVKKCDKIRLTATTAGTSPNYVTLRELEIKY